MVAVIVVIASSRTGSKLKRADVLCKIILGNTSFTENQLNQEPFIHE